ncbi:kinase-like protein [Xylaria grammica]|nr:kinase-like protein [Xylaria grammica]
MYGDHKQMESLSRPLSRQSFQDSRPSSSSSRSLSRKSSQSSNSSSHFSSGQSLYDRLKREVVEEKGSKTDTFSFLPRNAIDEIITAEIVKAQSSWYDFFKDITFRSGLISYSRSDQVVEQAKGVLAILGLCEREGDICNLFDEGLRDQHLPLELQVEGNGPKVLVSREGREFKSFLSWRKLEIECFLKKQWLVLAPIFKTRGEHISIDGNAPLPFYDVKTLSHSTTSTISKGRLHAAHLMPKAENDPQIAIKSYVLVEDFKKEKENLEVTKALNRPHLIRHIATVEQGNSFYVILYWADGGSLTDFWMKYPDVSRTQRPKPLWCFQQMLGLVEALFALHGGGCRHGDLKPENLLHFQNSDDPEIRHSQYGTLVMADVGISRVHHTVTELRDNPTNTFATTRSYEGPEAEIEKKKPRSRRYDMWSAGCIFTEFAIWLLYGCKAIDAFREQRKVFSQKAAYYKCTEHTAEINPAVKAGFDALRNDARCAGLTDLVNLIAKYLIVIDPRERAKAEALRDRFKEILRKADEDPGYLTDGIEPPSSIPAVFAPPG